MGSDWFLAFWLQIRPKALSKWRFLQDSAFLPLSGAKWPENDDEQWRILPIGFHGIQKIKHNCGGVHEIGLFFRLQIRAKILSKCSSGSNLFAPFHEVNWSENGDDDWWAMKNPPDRFRGFQPGEGSKEFNWIEIELNLLIRTRRDGGAGQKHLKNPERAQIFAACSGGLRGGEASKKIF